MLRGGRGCPHFNSSPSSPPRRRNFADGLEPEPVLFTTLIRQCVESNQEATAQAWHDAKLAAGIAAKKQFSGDELSEAEIQRFVPVLGT